MVCDAQSSRPPLPLGEGCGTAPGVVCNSSKPMPASRNEDISRPSSDDEKKPGVRAPWWWWWWWPAEVGSRPAAKSYRDVAEDEDGPPMTPCCWNGETWAEDDEAADDMGMEDDAGGGWTSEQMEPGLGPGVGGGRT